MFRKLLRLETEAMLRCPAECEGEAGLSDAVLKTFADELEHGMPALPQRFGVCAFGNH